MQTVVAPLDVTDASPLVLAVPFGMVSTKCDQASYPARPEYQARGRHKGQVLTFQLAGEYQIGEVYARSVTVIRTSSAGVRPKYFAS